MLCLIFYLCVLKCTQILVKYESSSKNKNTTCLGLKLGLSLKWIPVCWWSCDVLFPRHPVEEKWMNVTMVEQWSGIQRTLSTVYVKKATKGSCVKKVIQSVSRNYPIAQVLNIAKSLNNFQLVCNITHLFLFFISRYWWMFQWIDHGLWHQRELHQYSRIIQLPVPQRFRSWWKKLLR